ncbi:unnamed protein product [Lupinus luteus]|uniref:Uncharacterized protein n=1 Tax=Lupinus luteus TaxID=3873 RepID=A0AAV1W5F0_LUPLU
MEEGASAQTKGESKEDVRQSKRWTIWMECEAGTKSGRSFFIEDGALQWIVQNTNNEAAPIKLHMELALCHLAQHEVNAKDMISGGALWELVQISRDCSREDIQRLAPRTLSSISTFTYELGRLLIDC